MSKKAATGKGRGRPKKAEPKAEAEKAPAVTDTSERVYSDNDQRVQAIRDIFTRIGRIDQKLIQVAADRKEYMEQRESCFQEIKRITFDAQDRLPLAEKTEQRTCRHCARVQNVTPTVNGAAEGWASKDICANCAPHVATGLFVAGKPAPEERTCSECGKKETVVPIKGEKIAGWKTLDPQARKFICADCDQKQKRVEAAGDFIVEEGKISAVAIQGKFGVKHSEAKSLLFALMDVGLLEKAGAGNILKLNTKAAEEWKALKAKEEKAEEGK